MLRINALGGLSVERDGVLLAGAAAQPRRLAILAVLARAGARGVSRERLMALLWPEADDERARRALAQALYSLRRDLGDEEAIAGSKELRLDVERVSSDVGELEAAVADGDLERAGRSYPAPFLDGFHIAGVPEFERWVDGERAAVEQAWMAAAEQLALRTESRGEHASAARIWRRLATIDPLNARVAQRLMRALAESGDRAGALRHARIYEALLHEELALPPDREVVALARQLRAEAEVRTAEHAVPVPPAANPSSHPVAAPARATAPVRAAAQARPYAPPLAGEVRASPVERHAAAEPVSRPRDPAVVVTPGRSGGLQAIPSVRPSRWRDSRMMVTVRGIRRSVVRGLIATALLAIAAFAIAMRMRSAPARAQGATAVTEPTIAIGTIADRTGGKGTAAALGDLLATNLARAPGLHVVSPARLLELSRGATSADSADGAASVLGAARRAGATTVIDGALYALPDGRYRLDLRRIELATGDIASARAITGRDVFALADSATAEMRRMLGGRE